MPRTAAYTRHGRSLRAISLLAAMVGAVEATALPPSAIFGRQAICPKDFSRCTNFGSFCCPTGHTCLSLAGNTTLLCCPDSDCGKIETITCDISLQDVAKNPESKVKTTALGSTLPRCQDASKCCPFGFTCAVEGGRPVCVMDKDQTKPPPPASSTTGRAPASTSTSVLSSTSSFASATTTAIAQPTPAPGATTGASEGAETEAPSNGPSAAVIGGVAAGIVAAIILALVIACLLVKRKSKVEKPPSLKLTRSSSSFGNIISNPIIVEGTAMRSDFNRGPAKRGAGADGLSPAAAGLAYRTVSPPSSSGTGASASAARNLTANGLRHSSVAYGVPPPYATRPVSRGSGNGDSLPPPRTPRQPHQDREPSSVSINVFADPLALTPESASNAPGVGAGATRRYSNMTTFTQLMDEADLGGVARGGSFIPGTPQAQQGQGSPARR